MRIVMLLTAGQIKYYNAASIQASYFRKQREQNIKITSIQVAILRLSLSDPSCCLKGSKSSTFDDVVVAPVKLSLPIVGASGVASAIRILVRKDEDGVKSRRENSIGVGGNI